MNRLFVSIVCVMTFSQVSYSGLGKFDVYVSYSEDLHFRVGINHENYGIYLRPIFTKQSQNYYISDDQYLSSSVNQKGVESGINLNKVLFSYKKSETILNISSGFVISHVIIDGNRKYWEKAGTIAIIPEIRMLKKASITLTPLSYRFNFPVESINRGAKGYLDYLDMRIMQMAIGLKFYY